MTELNDLDHLRNRVKCPFAYKCPVVSSCAAAGREFEDKYATRCYKAIYQDIDATRVVLQDMTTRLSNAMFVARRLEDIMNE